MNQISIDGDVNGWFTEDIPTRFESYGWNVIKNINGHDFSNSEMRSNQQNLKRKTNFDLL